MDPITSQLLWLNALAMNINYKPATSVDFLGTNQLSTPSFITPAAPVFGAYNVNAGFPLGAIALPSQQFATGASLLGVKRRSSSINGASPSDVQREIKLRRSETASTASSSNDGKARRRRTCDKEGCSKLAQGRSTYCFAHGGGYRCQYPGCQSGARGCTSYCIKHGGGLRCSFPGCKSSARGKARLCISHGGGKRCAKDNCDKAAQGATSFCKRHLKEDLLQN